MIAWRTLSDSYSCARASNAGGSFTQVDLTDFGQTISALRGTDCHAQDVDAVMKQPNSELMAEVFPGTPLKEGCGEFETLLSIDKARRELGYDPQHS